MLTIKQRLSLATRHHQAGNLREAEDLYRGILRESPSHPQALHLLGLVAQQVERHAEAIDLIGRALAAHGPHPVFQCNLAASHLALRQLKEAEELCRASIRLNPNIAEAHNNLGVALLWSDREVEAEAAFRNAIRVGANHLDSRTNLATILQRRGRHAEALSPLREAVRIAPGNAPVRNQLGWSLLTLHEPQEAVVHLREAVRLQPIYPEAINNLGVALRETNQDDAAVRCFEEAVRLNPNSISARHNLCQTLETQGKFAEAIDGLEEMLRLAPDDSMTLTSLGRLASSGLYRFSAERLQHVEKLAAREDLPPDDRARLYQVLVWVSDRDNAYEQAFAYCRQARALRKEADRRRGIVYDRAEHRSCVDRTIGVFTPDWFSRAAGFGIQSELPIFIIGMMRSGTSLVEQILASHPRVCGAGELPDVGLLLKELPQRLRTVREYPECASLLDAQTSRSLAEKYLAKLRELGGPAARVVDKMPFNYLRLGFIAALFPGAKVIHCRRDPLDTCLSCYLQNFSGSHPYALDLADLGYYYREYRRLMAYWKSVVPVAVFDLDYESLTANLESESRRLLDFCGLEWDERCLRFNETQRVVRTSSVLQVRQPIYRDSIGKWKHYQAHLQPLIETLRED